LLVLRGSEKDVPPDHLTVTDVRLQTRFAVCRVQFILVWNPELCPGDGVCLTEIEISVRFSLGRWWAAHGVKKVVDEHHLGAWCPVCSVGSTVPCGGGHIWQTGQLSLVKCVHSNSPRHIPRHFGTALSLDPVEVDQHRSGHSSTKQAD
jgi:hypothetical protein